MSERLLPGHARASDPEGRLARPRSTATASCCASRRSAPGAEAIEQGALYPALYRLEHDGLLESGVGRLGQQPQGEVLPADRGRPQAAQGRDRELAALRGGHRGRAGRAARRGLSARAARELLARRPGARAPRARDGGRDRLSHRGARGGAGTPRTGSQRGAAAGAARVRSGRALQGGVPRVARPAPARRAAGRPALRDPAARHAKAFSLSTIAILGIGIGASTAIFSTADAVLIKLLPVERPQELRRLAWLEGERPRSIARTTAASSGARAARHSQPRSPIPSMPTCAGTRRASASSSASGSRAAST